jgi:DNA repair exonuclease SbcCD ATPase subunit
MHVQPEHRSLAGLADLRPVLQSIANMPATQAGQRSKADFYVEAAERLAAKVVEVRKQLPAVVAPSGDLTPDAVAAGVLEAVKQARQAAEDAVAAIDALRDCKVRASRYVERTIEQGQACEACPVCDRPIAAADLRQALEAAARSEIPGAAEWRSSADTLKRLEGELSGLLAQHRTAAEAAVREHGAIADAIRKELPRLQRARDWSPSVVQTADAIREACEAWSRAHASAFSQGAIADAQAIVDSARDSLAGLVSEDARLNEGLARAQSTFQAFQRLGTLLDVRDELDRVEWTLRLDEVEADRRREAQRARWRRVLEQLADGFRARAERANASVVDDRGVQERFRRLLDRLRTSQPTLAELGFRGSSVTGTGVDRSEGLSEGQTVLVNIAAAIAVAGKVAGTPVHRPGWIAFDEPTNGLDEASRDAVADYLGGITMQDLPAQIFVTTFDVPFVSRLIAAARRTGRRVRHVELPPFAPGQAVRPIERVA